MNINKLYKKILMKIHNIADSYQLSSSYSVILCDLWGVVHNGKEIFELSKKFLTQVKADGKKIYSAENLKVGLFK